jgi:two-component system chemotaxis response regulator CheB
MQKNILIVDDSALMRSILRDIIDGDERFHVADMVRNGVEALDLLIRKPYDVVVLDVNMPRMNGLQLLEEIRKYKISVRVLMASTDTTEGAKITLDALELGALDFIHKPDTVRECKSDSFHKKLLQILEVVANSRIPVFESKERTIKERAITTKMVDIIKKNAVHVSGRKIVAIASSTGGPKALQTVIPKLPADLNAPVLVVQHMPKGFTATLAERLNATSSITVREAQEGDELKRGVVYLAMGGKHMNVYTSPAGKVTIRYSDEPYREGVKPCANYMYESLTDSKYDEVVCVVMTGMGQDGTVGIKNLMERKHVHVIAQNEESCIVYGMPKSIAERKMADQVVPLEQIAQEIILNVGVI